MRKDRRTVIKLSYTEVSLGRDSYGSYAKRLSRIRYWNTPYIRWIL